MKRIGVFFVAILILGGCAIKTEKLYDVQAGSGIIKYAGGTCSPPTSSYSFSAAPGADVVFSARVVNQNIVVQFILKIQKGHRVKLQNSFAVINSDDLQKPLNLEIEKFQIETFGKSLGEVGFSEKFDPRSELSGLGRNEGVTSINADAFRSYIVFSANNRERFSLELPSMLVDGVEVKIKPIHFSYREQTYASTCIQ